MFTLHFKQYSRPIILILALRAHHTQPQAAWKRGFLPIELYQLDHTGVCAWTQEECSHCLLVSMQGCHHRAQYVEMAGKHVRQVVEGGGQVWLESWALTRQQACYITWYLTTASRRQHDLYLPLNILAITVADRASEEEARRSITGGVGTMSQGEKGESHTVEAGQRFCLSYEKESPRSSRWQSSHQIFFLCFLCWRS